MVAWNVYLKGKLVDVVFFTGDCNADYVYRSLVNHDGYNPRIYVEEALN